MKKINLIVRLGLFALILGLGTMGALMLDETKGLAFTDLSGTSVHVMAAVTQGDVVYATFPAIRKRLASTAARITVAPGSLLVLGRMLPLMRCCLIPPTTLSFMPAQSVAQRLLSTSSKMANYSPN